MLYLAGISTSSLNEMHLDTCLPLKADSQYRKIDQDTVSLVKLTKCHYKISDRKYQEKQGQLQIFNSRMTRVMLNSMTILNLEELL